MSATIKVTCVAAKLSGDVVVFEFSTGTLADVTATQRSQETKSPVALCNQLVKIIADADAFRVGETYDVTFASWGAERAAPVLRKGFKLSPETVRDGVTLVDAGREEDDERGPRRLTPLPAFAAFVSLKGLAPRPGSDGAGELAFVSSAGPAARATVTLPAALRSDLLMPGVVYDLILAPHGTTETRTLR